MWIYFYTIRTLLNVAFVSIYVISMVPVFVTYTWSPLLYRDDN